MPDVIPGVNVAVVDEPALGPGAPTDTSTAILITSDTAAPLGSVQRVSSPAQARALMPTATGMLPAVDAILNEAQTDLGGPELLVTRLGPDAAGLDAALAALPATLGPAQVIAPEVVTATDIATIGEWCWDTNRVLLANGPRNATDAQLAAIADAVVASGHGRNVALFADTAIIPGIGEATREVPWSAVQAGLIARNDLNTGNPVLAAAGDQGVCVYALGLLAERSDIAMTTLNAAQVNVARAPYQGAVRGYGYRTLANLALLPHWWDLGGSRVVMDVRANSASSTDRIQFGTFDAGGELLGRWNGLLTDRCLELLRAGALFGNPLDAFTIDTTPRLNPVAELAKGRGRASLKLKTSPYAEALDVSIIRQPIA